MTPEVVTASLSEVRRIQLESLWAAERHFAAETPWYHAHYTIGGLVAVLAALSGTAALQDWSILAAVIALLATILSALQTFLSPSEKAAVHHANAKNFEALYRRAGLLYRTARAEAPGDLTSKLQTIATDFDALLKDEPALSGRAYRDATGRMKDGDPETKASREDVAAAIEWMGSDEALGRPAKR